MKKVLFSVLIVLVLLWSFGVVFAQGRGKAGSRRKGDKQAIKEQKRSWRRQADANESERLAKGGRTRARKRFQKRLEEQEKMREMMRKGKEGFKVGKDTAQQFEAIQKQIAHEEAKHLRRVTRMKRIQELALEEGNEDIVKRVDTLRQKEEGRYERKRRILRIRRRILIQAGDEEVRPPSVGRKGRRDIKKRPDGRKNKGRSRSRGEKSSSKQDPGS